METDRLTAILSRRVAGEVECDGRTLSAASLDFGRVIQRRPGVVVSPLNTEDVVAIVRTAREVGVPVSVRGEGHSQGGQALNHGGIIIRTARLGNIESVRLSDNSIVAGAGAKWRDVVRSSLEHDLIPNVLTDHLNVTVGGTLSVGGLGPASFRHGAQIDNCLGLEIALGTGEVHWLDEEHSPNLFQCVLGGLGQFGVITKAKLRLRPSRQFIRHYYLSYDSIQAFLAAARLMIARGDVDLLSGAASPPVGTTSTHEFVLVVGVESDEESTQLDTRLLHGTNPIEVTTESMTLECHLDRLDQKLQRFQRSDRDEDAHPWVEHFLPIEAVPEYVETVTRMFPSDPLLLWPMRGSAFGRSMLRPPTTESMMLVGLLCWRECSEVLDVLPQLRKLHNLGISLRGKRYLSGWLDFDDASWQKHFGQHQWRRIKAMRQICDPGNLFRLWNPITGEP